MILKIAGIKPSNWAYFGGFDKAEEEIVTEKDTPDGLEGSNVFFEYFIDEGPGAAENEAVKRRLFLYYEDHTVVVTFNTRAYLLNDEGKTIERF